MMTVEQHEGFYRVRAPAKINVGLRVLGKRADGFHELESLVLAIGLADTLEGCVRANGAMSLVVESEDGETPADESNLVLRAGRLLAAETGSGQGAELRLVKRVPVGRGLGGGSSDAAAALALLNEAWGTGLDRERLSELGAKLGSDVPFFLNGPAAVMRGRGEIIEAVNETFDAWVVLVVPAFGLSTALVYGRCIPPLTASGGAAILWVDMLRDGKLERLGRSLVNDLESPARALRGELADLRKALEAAGGRCVSMTGSGSAMFSLASTEEEARGIAGRLGVDAQTRVCIVPLWNGIGASALPLEEGEPSWK